MTCFSILAGLALPRLGSRPANAFSTLDRRAVARLAWQDAAERILASLFERRLFGELVAWGPTITFNDLELHRSTSPFAHP